MIVVMPRGDRGVKNVVPVAAVVLMWLDDAWKDFRLTLRTLAKNRGFTAAAILTIAVGIGANTSIFSVVNTLLLKPLPYKDSDRLVRLVMNTHASASPAGTPGRLAGTMSIGELGQLRRYSKTLSHVACYVNDFKTLTGVEETARLEGWRVEPAVLEMIGVQPMLGRVFDPGEAETGAGAVIILSYLTWQRHFAGDRSIVGRTISLDGAERSVIGVMPEGFEFPFELANWDYWIPLSVDLTSESTWNIRFPALARLADGASLQAASAEADVLLREPNQPGRSYEFVRLRDELAAPVKPALFTLTAGAALLLLIACGNTTSLQLARLTARKREIAIRSALGAGRGRVIRHLLTESLMLALLGGAVGTLLAAGGVHALKTLGTTLSRMDVGQFSNFPRLSEIALDTSVLAFAIATSVITGILLGLAPALRYSHADPMDMLREGPSSALSGFFHSNRARAVLVVAEIAMAVVLVAAGGLLIHSFLKLTHVNLGYDPSNVLTFQVATPAGRYPGQQIKSFAESLVTRLRSTPGVQAASYTVVLPMTGLLKDSAWIRRTPEVPVPPPSPEKDADARFVGEDYLKVMGIGVVAGRGFEANDREGRPRVVVINRRLARLHFPGENPIGQAVYLLRERDPWQVIGIVDDVRQAGLDKEPEPQVFVDIRQWPGMAPGLRFLQYFVVRTQGHPTSVTGAVRGVLRQIDSRAAVYNVASMEQLVSNSASRSRLNAAVVGVFGLVALTLAAIGIYGLIAYSVVQRTREIGIRMALGAQRSDVMLLVLRESLILAGVGIALGLTGAVAVTRYIEGMLFGLTPLDPMTFVIVSSIFTLVAMLASYLPAHRATNIDPLSALRYE